MLDRRGNSGFAGQSIFWDSLPCAFEDFREANIAPQKPNSTLREGRRDGRDLFGDVPSSFLYSLTLRWHSSHTSADGTGDITAQPLQKNNVIMILGSQRYSATANAVMQAQASADHRPRSVATSIEAMCLVHGSNSSSWHTRIRC